MSIRLLHLADLHLGFCPEKLGECAAARRSEYREAFRRAVDFALEKSNRIHGVLLAGDQFESHAPAREETDFFIKQLERLAGAGLPVVMIPGNHDAHYYPNSVYQREIASGAAGARLVTQPNVGAPLSLEINGEPLHVYGMAYQPRLSRPPFDEFLPADLPGWHVALLHGAIQLAGNWGLHDNKYVPLDAVKLKQCGMHYIALGHYHTFADHGDGRCPIVYCGSLERKSSRESAERVLVVAELDAGSARVETHPFDARPVLEYELNLSQQEDLSPEALAAAVGGALPANPIVKLVLSGATAQTIDTRRLEQLLREKLARGGNYCFVEIEDQSRLLKQGQLGRWAEERTLRGLFVRRMLEQIEQASDAAAQEHLQLALKLALHEMVFDE